MKMCLVAVGGIVAAIFQRSLRRNEHGWEHTLSTHGGIRALAIVTSFISAAVIVLGRLIAYDHVWGAWSPAGGG